MKRVIASFLLIGLLLTASSVVYGYRNRYLGNTGSANGSQCFWKTEGNNGISADDVWIMFN